MVEGMLTRLRTYFDNTNMFITDTLGYDSIGEFIKSVFGLKNKLITGIGSVLAVSISTFIENNLWEDPSAVYFLYILLALDVVTGFIKLWYNRKNTNSKYRFKSRRINRSLGRAVAYAIILYISFNMDKHLHVFFFWLPYAALGSFYATEGWSIIENLTESGLLGKQFSKTIKNKLKDTSSYIIEDKNDLDASN